MKENQAAGYLFEEEIRNLLEESGFVDVRNEPLEGRGTNHEIDAYGIYSIPVPFTYPIRLIAEAKCYEDSIELPLIRSFFGVVTDISENYFSRKGEKNVKARFLDTGCFFAANSFTKPSQDFAWAHNIFLVSFSGIEQMKAVVNNIRNFLQEPEIKEMQSLNKEDLITHYQIWKSNPLLTKERSHSQYPSIVFGILDKIYPVVLVGNSGWHKQIRIPSDSDKIRGRKISRTPLPDATMFDIVVGNIQGHLETFYFTVPNGIADKLISKIEKTDAGNKIFELDIPIIIWNSEKSVRRIISVDVVLTDNEREEYYQTIKGKPEQPRKKTRWECIEL